MTSWAGMNAGWERRTSVPCGRPFTSRRGHLTAGTWKCKGEGAEVPFAAAEVVNSGVQGNQFRRLSGIHFG
jgi:hypothetical protein